MADHAKNRLVLMPRTETVGRREREREGEREREKGKEKKRKKARYS